MNNETMYHRHMSSNDSFFAGEQAQRLPFGTALKVRRQKLGYTQKEVAEKLGLTSTTVVKLEQRIEPPRNRSYLKELTKVYLGTMEELLTGYIPAGFPMHRKGSTGGDGDANTQQWDMANPLDRKARLRIAWEQIRENISIISELAPNELWQVGEALTAAQRDAAKKVGLIGSGKGSGSQHSE